MRPSSMMRGLALGVAALGSATLGCASRPAADVPAATAATGYTAAQCPSCAEWNAPTGHVRLFANVHYVGTRGLSAILVTSPQGHVLIDAGLPESAEPIMRSVEAAGFRVEDIRRIVTSHAHYDHAGGVAAIQRRSGATVAGHPWSLRAMRTGRATPGDPQFEIALPYPAVAGPLDTLSDGDTVRVGPIALVAHYTGGHTPGGTSWSWRSCEGDACADFVYADSQTPVSAEGFLYSRNDRYPNAVADFERGFATLERLSCDVLITPHPSASRLWERLAAGPGALRDPEACARYAANARTQLAARLARERAPTP